MGPGLRRLLSAVRRLSGNPFFWILMSAVVGPIAGYLPYEHIQNETLVLVLDNRYLAIIGCWVLVFVTAARSRRRFP